MVYLKGVLVKTTMAVVIIAICVATIAETATTKIAYKKAIQGKTNVTKEKRLKVKPEVPAKPMSQATPVTAKTTTATTTTTAALAVTTENSIAAAATATATTMPPNVSAETTVEKVATTRNSVEGVNSKEIRTETTKVSNESASSELAVPTAATDTTEEISDEVTPVVDIPLTQTTPMTNSIMPTTTTSSSTSTTTAATTTTTVSNQPVPCTCGVFMTSQIRRGGSSNEQPVGRPVILNELDRTFPHTAVGQKQCQTKCLETIVQHLPNSANILCATLNRDCRKERAYLFIKNYRNHWINTSLAAGREYCCKNGQPYTCPMV